MANPNQNNPQIPQNNTRRLINFALIASIAFPAILFATIAIFDYNLLVDRFSREARSRAEMLREHSLKILETLDLILNSFEYRTAGMDWQTIARQRNDLVAEFQPVIDRHPQVSILALTDPEGRQQVAIRPSDLPRPRAGLSHRDREYWWGQRDSDQGLLITRTYFGESSRKPKFALSRRRVTPDGTFDGTLHAAASVSYFVDFWERAQRSLPDARIALVRRDGYVLARVPAVQHLPRLTDQSSSLFRHMQAAGESAVYTTTSVIDGTECIFGVAQVGKYPLFITYAIPTKVLLGAWVHHLILVGGLCIFVSLAVAGSILFIRRQTRDLQEEQVRRASAETAALEAQRLEAVGQIAAGVAHDFGNLVQAVEMGASLIERRAEDGRVRDLAKIVATAAKQGRALARQLTDCVRPSDDADAGSAVLAPRTTVADVARLIATTLGNNCQVHFEDSIGDSPAVVHGDEAGLERAIINLAVNARDAMPQGGRIVIRVEAQQIAPTGLENDPVHLLPGMYARISVSDNGPGIPPEVLAQIGRRFFTTKPRGQGTGLGLVSVRAYAERYGGALHIQSEVGSGTTVTLWLPAVQTDEEGVPSVGFIEAEVVR